MQVKLPPRRLSKADQAKVDSTPLTAEQWGYIQANIRLIWKFAIKYTPPGLRNDEDAIQQTFEVLFDKAIRSARTYEREKSKFGTYALNYAWRAAFEYWERQLRAPDKFAVSLSPKEGFGSDFAADQKTTDPTEIAEPSKFVPLLDCLTPRRRQFMVLRFGLEDGIGRSSPEVSRLMGISNRRGRQLYCQSINELRHLVKIRGMREDD